MHGIDKRETYACAVVIPPDGGICMCFGASIRGMDWMVTPQTSLRARSLQTFNAGVLQEKVVTRVHQFVKNAPRIVTRRGHFSK